MNERVENPIRVMRIIARMNMGGPAVQVSGLMRELNKSEFNQCLVTGYCAKGEVDYLDTVARDVTAIRIQGLGRRISIAADLRALTLLVYEIRKFKPHIVHTHTAKAGFLGRLASIISLQPSIRIHTFHGHLLRGYFSGYKRSLVVVAEKLLALCTDQLLAVGDKFGLMPPGVEISELPLRSESRDVLSLEPDILQCAFIGRVTQIKRPDRFLDVVSEIKKRDIKLEFFIAGDGELLNKCRERIKKENLPVKVLGWQNDIERVLSSADMVVLTSDNEGTPLSLIQAGMAGLPVVTTNVGSIPEVVLDGVTGIVTSVDVLDIADALENLCKEKELRIRLGIAAREFTLSNFGISNLVSNHEELYKKLIANRAKS
jgi:glycosyltransferase involved in cell wall biosynthesis